MPIPDLDLDHGGRPRTAPIDVDVVLVLGENMHPLGRHGCGVDKDAAAIVVGAQHVGHARLPNGELVPADPDAGGPGTGLAVVLEARKGAATAGAREESELPGPDDLEGPVANLKLAASGAIVAAGAETEVPAAAADEGVDGGVAGAVEDAAVAEVRATGEDQQGAGRSPGLLQEGRLSNGGDGIVGRQQTTQGEEGMLDRLGGGAAAFGGVSDKLAIVDYCELWRETNRPVYTRTFNFLIAISEYQARRWPPRR
jgi:hypothetical protein